MYVQRHISIKTNISRRIRNHNNEIITHGPKFNLKRTTLEQVSLITYALHGVATVEVVIGRRRLRPASEGDGEKI